MNGSSGKLVIISGPSGAGKSTVVAQLLVTSELPLQLSVSATTRRPRKNEVPGKDYHFLSLDEFQRRLAADEFLEHKEVFGRGDWYGTLREEVSSGLRQGKWVVLEIDVQGALAVVERIDDAITIFIHPGSMTELERRLRDRGTETEESLTRRLEVAQQEMKAIPQYRHEVINDDKDRTVRELCELLKSYAV